MVRDESSVMMMKKEDFEDHRQNLIVKLTRKFSLSLLRRRKKWS